MPTLEIEAKGCRACTLCVDLCPTKVFDLEPNSQVAQASRPTDCIGCCSCEYICPSRCLSVTDTTRQLPFYHLDHTSDLVSKFLQQQPAQSQLTANDVEEALGDVRTRLRALGDSVTETMGRGIKVVGRTAGTLAAAHLPDLYEETALETVLERLQDRFGSSFPFKFEVKPDGSVRFAFSNCAIKTIVDAGETALGADALCVLFHEYWAGLIGEFCKRKFLVQADHSDKPCSFSITAR
jgi:NAD-dependent dihydropyrimidine dehydrogenase PreA subunit